MGPPAAGATRRGRVKGQSWDSEPPGRRFDTVRHGRAIALAEPIVARPRGWF